MRRFRTPASEITQPLRTSTALWRKTTTLIALSLAAAMIAVIAIAAIAIPPATSSKTPPVNAASAKPTTMDFTATATVTDSAPTDARLMASLPVPSPHAPSPPPDDPADTAVCRQSWTYDSEGNVLTHTDRRGITTVNVYDPENRLVSETRAGLLLQTLGRDAEGNIRQHTDALGHATAFIYDKANRKLSEDRSGLAIERWTYTPLGDVATYADADGRTTTNTYTSRRLLESESLAGETTRYAYDGAGHRVSRERPNGPDSTWTYAYDAAGNLAAVTDPGGRTTTFGHDANNNRTRTTDANDHATTFAYDERNRLSGKTNPGGDNWRWTYDGDNNRIRSTAPNGRVADTTYDALNRATRTDYGDALPGEVQSSAFTYDGNGNTRTITETSSAGIRTETRGYDDFDRLTEVTDGDGRTLRYAYDAVGNRTRLTDSDGHDTVWTYNELNQNTRVTVPGMGSTSLGYAPSGRVTEISRPDGSLTEQAFFDDGRLQSIRHSKAGQTLARYDYVYDPNGNRTEQREFNGATTADTTQRTRYVYDDADRLVEVQEPNRTTTYTLDAVGNRVAERVVDGNGVVLSDSILTYDERDQLTRRSDPTADVHVDQTWDANGNLATQTVDGQPPRIHTYDARDRLVSLTLPSSPNGPATLRFAYHANGLRREKTDGVTTTRYQYDGQSLLAETNAIGNTLRQFHYSATQLVAQTQAGTTPIHRHVLLDALRSPIALLDPTGLVTARTSYDAFGEIRAQLSTNGTLTTPNRDAANAELVSTDNQPVGFTGYTKDSESGLYYAKARYYDPATARFTTEDPEAGKDLEPPSLHRYLYAYANPTVYLDPTGRESFCFMFHTGCGLRKLTPEEEEKQTQAYGMLLSLPLLGVTAAEGATVGSLAWVATRTVGWRWGLATAAAEGAPLAETVIGLGAAATTGAQLQPTPLTLTLPASAAANAAGRLESAEVRAANSMAAKTSDFPTPTITVGAKSKTITESNSDPSQISVQDPIATQSAAVDPALHIGSGQSLSRATAINPSGRLDNCSACVAATIQNKLERRTPDDLVTADQIELQHGYSGENRALSVDQSLAYIEQATGTMGVKTPIAKAGAPVGPYAVFGTAKENGGGHVMYGQVLPNGKYYFYDPQSGGGRILLEAIQIKYKDLKSYYMAKPE